MGEFPVGQDYVWLARDALDHLAVFANAGFGPGYSSYRETCPSVAGWGWATGKQCSQVLVKARWSGRRTAQPSNRFRNVRAALAVTSISVKAKDSLTIAVNESHRLGATGLEPVTPSVSSCFEAILQ
jgi:hypothetical protein